MKKISVGHVYVPEWVMCRSDLTPMEKFLFGKIVGLTGKNGYCFATNDWIGYQMGLSGNRVSRYISKYVQLGILRREVLRDKNNAILQRKLYVYEAPSTIPPIVENDNTPIVENDIVIQENISKNIYIPPLRGGSPSKKDQLGEYLDKFNSLFDRQFTPTKARSVKLKQRLKTYAFEQLLTGLENMAKNEFFRGVNDTGWSANPDYALRNDEIIDKMLNMRPSVKPKIDLLKGGFVV